MEIYLVSISNIKFLSYNKTLAIGVIHQYLYEKGYRPGCIDIFLDLSSEQNSIEYATYVPEIADLPRIMTIVKNYSQNRENLLEGIDDFSEIQREVIDRLTASVAALHVPEQSIWGFSTTYLSYLYSVVFAFLVRRKSPGVKIVFGGYHMTLSKNVMDFTLSSGIADIVVEGDGCSPMLDVIEGRLHGGSVRGFFQNQASWPLQSLLSAPLDNHAISTLTSVGCPFDCFFCASKREHILYDLDEFKRYIEQLKTLTEVEHLRLVDDEVNPTVSRGLALCNTMRNLELSWDCFLTPVNLSEVLVEALTESGCIGAFLGTETFNDIRLGALNKRSTEENNIRAISMLAEHGIRVTVGVIFGFPGETQEEAEHTYEVCRELKEKFGELVFLAATSYKLYPGSHHYNSPGNFGIKLSYWGAEYLTGLPGLSAIIAKIPMQFDIGDERKLASRQMVNKLRTLEPPGAVSSTQRYLEISY